MKRAWILDTFGRQLSQCQNLPCYGNKRKMKPRMVYDMVGQASVTVS